MAGTLDLVVEPLTVRIGAEMHGVDLSSLDGPTFDAIHRALLDRKVLVFRDQHRLDAASHIALGRRFGPLMTPNVIAGDGEHPELYILESRPDAPPSTDCWHVDSTYMAEPAMLSVLRARVLPAVGGDTLWADMEAVYEHLDNDSKERFGRYATRNSVARLGGYRTDERKLADAEAVWPAVEHPLVRTHPETGRRCLFFNQQTYDGVVGLPEEESTRLLADLLALVAVPDVQCRVRWSPDTVVMWDNRCTQHYAVADYVPAYRRMERVTVRGDRPF